MTRKRTVRFEPLGLTIECEATEPILHYALRQGLRLVDARCAEGDCGGCKALVHSGQIHRVEPPTPILSATEVAQGHVLLCRTHVQSDLVVELLPDSLLAPPLRPEAHGSRRAVAEALVGPFLVAAADHLSDGLLVLDDQARLLILNQAAAHLLGDPSPSGEMSPEITAVCRTILASALPHTYQVAAPSGRVLSAVGFPILQGYRAVAAALLFPASPLSTAPILRKQKSVVVGAKYAFSDLVGHSPAFSTVLKIGLIAAGNSLPVLLSGESGTGKEMLAHAIHASSPRALRPFIAVNCGAIPRELIESELFGYDEGTFTGARRGGKHGRFEEAQGGTLFLDEVSECSPSTQIALLRVLQEQEITRLGSSTRIPIDVRVIAATNKDLLKEVAKGSIREDLYYRLNVLSIHLPPLRDRREDIPLLAASFLADVAAALHCPDLHFSEDALRHLAMVPYPWPGNIRELRNVLQQVGVLLPHPEITWDDFPASIRMGRGEVPAADRPDAAGWLAQAERQLIRQIVQQCAGNLSQAAHQLGISRSTLYRKLDQFGLKRQLLLGSD
ncbi:sigma 54-interacting transcriptional regulator [Candidatus Methylomirabilis sp.]|uniref:sigma 54-interacting transcriptional regulator n=1 Tax=Candidatus Methylomirabilis sp. TaxID=2032687 RepID=UPI003C72A9CC